jgi:hypothetical protein
MTPNTPQQYKQQAPARNPISMPIGQELNQITDVCRSLGTCKFYQGIGIGGVLAVWLTARELGLPPMMCLNGGLYTFDGKVTMSAQLMNMMIVNAGHRADVLQLTDKICKIRFVRRDRQKGHGDTFEYDFTIDMASKAGYLSKTNWKTSPRDMLYSRCLSGGARKFMPDVIMNCYAFGEIEDDKFSDAHLVNVLPDIQLVETEEVKEEPPIVNPPGYNATPLALEKLPDYDLFINKQFMEHGNNILEYVKATCDKAKMEEIQVWNSAIKNEEIFIERFHKWKAKAPQIADYTPKSMDELVM